MRFSTILVILLIFSSLSVQAQPGRFFLRGVVMHNKRAVDKVSIFVYSGRTRLDSTTSNSNGKYQLSLPLNKKFIVQFVYSQLAPKTISVETVVPKGMETLDFNKYMVIALEERNGTESEDVQPVAQFKINANGELQEMGLQYQEVPRTSYQQDEIITSVETEKELQKKIRAARDQVSAMLAQAQAELDSARREAYRIRNKAEMDARNTAQAKPKVVYKRDTVYVNRDNSQVAAKINNDERITSLQSEISKRKQDLIGNKQLLEQLQLMSARSFEDSLKINEISQTIVVAEAELAKLMYEKEAAEETIRFKDLQIRARNRALVYISIITLLVLLSSVVIYRNYKAKRRLVAELFATNNELQELSTIISQTDNAVVLFDLQGNLEWINQGFTRMYGYEFEDLESFKLDNIFLRKDKEQSSRYFEQTLERGTQVSYESSTPHKNGQLVWTQTTMTPIVNGANQLVKIAAIDSNITEIQNARAEIRQQKEKLELHNRMIQDSIKYAHTIQEAFLPPLHELNDLFDHFVINLPKDIVSGDFIWYNQVERDNREIIFLATVDCTGHGVPGAFMSMIGSRLLTEITSGMGVLDPGAILDLLDVEVRKALKQDTTENTDGMDVCLCSLEMVGNKQYKVNYAGAQRPLLHFDSTKGILNKIKGDIKTAGGFLSSFIDKRFTTHELMVQENDMLYLTSDGIFDQNGPDRKRFGTKRVNKLIGEYASQPVSVQKQLFEHALRTHQQNAEQRDDITVLGVRV